MLSQGICIQSYYNMLYSVNKLQQQTILFGKFMHHIYRPGKEGLPHKHQRMVNLSLIHPQQLPVVYSVTDCKNNNNHKQNITRFNN